MGPLIPLLGAGISGLFSWLGGKSAANAQNQATQASQPYYDALTGLVKQQQARISASDPLYQALLAMAQKRLPMYARTPTAPTGPVQGARPNTNATGRTVPGPTSDYPTGMAQAVRNENVGRSARRRSDW